MTRRQPKDDLGAFAGHGREPLSSEDLDTYEPRRIEVRAWLETGPGATAVELAEAGYVAPSWPLPWGRAADAIEALVIHDELARAGVVLPDNPIGIGWAGPTILAGGTVEQQRRYLPPLLAGDEFWCQLFSEPDSGSDLANIATSARLDGDSYVIRGQKVWSTWADHSDFGILIARTDPNVPKRAGISYFACPMTAPGVTVRPLREMTGETHFNEVFLDDVRLPSDCRIGAEGDGWRLTRLTLANERLQINRGGLCWGMGPDWSDFWELVSRNAPFADTTFRHRLVKEYINARILEWLDSRLVAAAHNGLAPGPAGSVKKLLAEQHAQAVFQLAKDSGGAGGMLTDVGPFGGEVERWHWGFLFSRALTIGGGTAEIQRNILGERLLGLPAEQDPTTSESWSSLRTVAG